MQTEFAAYLKSKEVFWRAKSKKIARRYASSGMTDDDIYQELCLHAFEYWSSWQDKGMARERYATCNAFQCIFQKCNKQAKKNQPYEKCNPYSHTETESDSEIRYEVIASNQPDLFDIYYFWHQIRRIRGQKNLPAAYMGAWIDNDFDEQMAAKNMDVDPYYFNKILSRALRMIEE